MQSIITIFVLDKRTSLCHVNTKCSPDKISGPMLFNNHLLLLSERCAHSYDSMKSEIRMGYSSGVDEAKQEIIDSIKLLQVVPVKPNF